MSGQVLITPFNETEATVVFEFAIPFPKELATGRINSPIKPDAVIMCGDLWIIVECKHNFKNGYLRIFNDKCDFIEQHIDKEWVHQNKYPRPKTIYRVACSITDFSNVDSNTPRITKAVRTSQSYEVLNI